jgi:hypothetical protein
MLVQIFFTCMMRAMFQNKTPEQRKASAAKGIATRKANREAAVAARLDAYQRVVGLRDQIEALEQKLASLARLEKMSAVSATLTGKALLRPDAIAKAAISWKRSPGVYFLPCQCFRQIGIHLHSLFAPKIKRRPDEGRKGRAYIF